MRKEPIAPRLDSINRNDSSNNLNKKNNKRSNLFKRNPFYSFALSIMCVGLGQIYNSQIIFGLLIFLTTVILIFLRSIENVYLFITLNILILAIWLLSIFHSVIYPSVFH